MGLSWQRQIQSSDHSTGLVAGGLCHTSAIRCRDVSLLCCHQWCDGFVRLLPPDAGSGSHIPGARCDGSLRVPPRGCGAAAGSSTQISGSAVGGGASGRAVGVDHRRVRGSPGGAGAGAVGRDPPRHIRGRPCRGSRRRGIGTYRRSGDGCPGPGLVVAPTRQAGETMPSTAASGAQGPPAVTGGTGGRRCHDWNHCWRCISTSWRVDSGLCGNPRRLIEADLTVGISRVW